MIVEAQPPYLAEISSDTHAVHKEAGAHRCGLRCPVHHQASAGLPHHQGQLARFWPVTFLLLNISPSFDSH